VGINQPIYGPKAQGYVRPNLYYEGSLAEKRQLSYPTGTILRGPYMNKYASMYLICLKSNSISKDYVFRLDRMENQSI
jgi:hypothetical protein